MSDTSVYWVCVVGPFPQSAVPLVSGAVPALTAKWALQAVTGVDAECKSAFVVDGGDVDVVRAVVARCVGQNAVDAQPPAGV